MKAATSLDGMTALPDGSSQWITGEAARIDGHHWRARACALLTGIGTVRDDDPRLTVRHVETERQPLRVLVDSRLEIAPTARLLEDGNLLIFAASAQPAKVAWLADRGVRVLTLPDPDGKVDLMAMMRVLGDEGINELHVEAGFRLNGSLLRAGCVDEWLLYLAPCLLGQATGFVNLPPVASLADREAFEFVSVERVGGDLRLLVRRARDSHPHRSGETAVAPV